ncbi:MAG: hypothetical protein GY796_00390 [Chloroflexi bacterium]|nr:hypothetical protein [Chloroflexota bacterium]
MYDTIYLSPHLDDAALSCGGQIFKQTAVGKNILIVTVMAGIPSVETVSEYAQELHERWQLAQGVVAARQIEDKVADQILGADYQHWETPDCIYRTDAQGAVYYADWAQIIGPIHPHEQALVKQLAHELENLPSHQQIVVPLAAGNHVDHQIVRQAAEHCFGDSSVYYEDYPYVCNEMALTTVIPPHTTEWQAQTIFLSTAAVQARIEAIAAYTSQVSTFFNGRADLEKQIRYHVQKIGGERVWHKSTAQCCLII